MSRSPRRKNFFRMITKREGVAVCTLFVVMLVSIGIFTHAAGVLTSPEVQFTDASPHGLAIVPASCPSDPFDADSPYGCNGGTDLCPDGSAAPNNDPSQCSCAQGNTNQCGGAGGSCPIGYYAPTPGQCVFVGCPAGYAQQGSSCVLTSCAVGYTMEGTQCVFTGCPGGYVQQGSQCILQQCSAGYICAGSNLDYQDATCHQTFSQACTYGCSAGACLPPPPPKGNISAAPKLLQQGETSQITWSAQYVVASTCSVSGSNGDSWSGASGSQTSTAIQGQTIYTLKCTGLDGSTLAQQVTINVVPTFKEQ